MFEELNAHRQAVQENIEKAFEIGFTGNENLEKAHQVGDIHPNGKWVWTQLPSGKYDWRVIKNKQGDNSTKSSSSEQSVDISKIPDKEFKRITNMLEKKNPLEKDAPRYLEEEAMSDSELKNFLACAEHFKNDTKNINQLTRYRCSEWAKLAKSELDNRQQSKKAKSTDDTQKNSAVDAKVKPSSKKNPSELGTIKINSQQDVKDLIKKIKSKKVTIGIRGNQRRDGSYDIVGRVTGGDYSFWDDGHLETNGGQLNIKWLGNGELEKRKFYSYRALQKFLESGDVQISYK